MTEDNPFLKAFETWQETAVACSELAVNQTELARQDLMDRASLAMAPGDAMYRLLLPGITFAVALERAAQHREK